jgi:hypothetical protein
LSPAEVVLFPKCITESFKFRFRYGFSRLFVQLRMALFTERNQIGRVICPEVLQLDNVMNMQWDFYWL